jgi:hypothetical protein
MMPGNPVVGGVILRRPAIQSPNYTAGSAGWAVNADGTAQFAQLTIYDPTGTGFFIEMQGTLLEFNPPDLNQVTGDQGTINADQAGDLLIFSGAVTEATAVEAGLQLTSSDSADNVSGGKSNISLIAETVTLNTVVGSDIPAAHVTGLPLAGAATLAQVITAVNNLYATLQAVRVIAP